MYELIIAALIPLWFEHSNPKTFRAIQWPCLKIYSTYKVTHTSKCIWWYHHSDEEEIVTAWYSVLDYSSCYLVFVGSVTRTIAFPPDQTLSATCTDIILQSANMHYLWIFGVLSYSANHHSRGKLIHVFQYSRGRNSFLLFSAASVFYIYSIISFFY